MVTRKNKPRGRFAPSPSGWMHLGNAWTALLTWLDIRKQGGAMVLRMEDLDPDRSRKEYADGLMDDLRWLGLDWDEGPDVGGPYTPYAQSKRTALYQATFDKLTQVQLVYPCFCSRTELRSIALAPHAGDTEVPYSGRCEKLDAEAKARMAAQGRYPALRLRVGDAVVEFVDEVYGVQRQVLSQACGDFVIRRSDGVFAYQLAVVADDADMKIDRILRGADLLASTPRQIYIWRLLGLQPPTFVHVPLLLGNDGNRLSKRHGSLALAALRSMGIRPESVIGQLAVWAGLTEKVEALQAKELIAAFDVSLLPRESIVVPDTLRFV
ncbi:MAG TPA: tRNA glutamyl-Q(34) synthetase GluQRS [Negativicutes bacterium]|nr:tRNA glutamyl-Q(34) synthetase GluQRS [Negativicutes bacterium]